MRDSTISSTGDVYEFVDVLKKESERRGSVSLVARLENALHLGSSGLEILGAVRQVMIENRSEIERCLGNTGIEKANRVIAFIDKAFGR